MKTSFLTGSFLPGYASIFKYNRPATPQASYPTLTSDLLTDRFNSRSKKYQTKRNRYGVGMQVGLATALVVILLAFSVPVTGENDFVIEEVRQELVVIEEIQQTQQQVKPPPPPRPTLPISVPDDELIEDIELDLDVSLELEEELANLTPPPAVEEEEDTEPEIFLVVEQPPKIIGGLASLNGAITYPKVAIQSGVEGTVVVQVVVNEEGLPISPKVVRSASPLLEQAAIDAVLKQKFEPGKQRGRAVKTAITIPVKFRLKG